MAPAKPKRKSTSAGRKSPIKARATKPDQDVGQTGAGWQEAQLEAAFWQFGTLEEYKNQVYVNEYTAQTYSAVWRCVTYISQTIASLGWHVFEGEPGKPGKKPIWDDIAWLLDMQASPEMSAFSFRETMSRDLLLWGNGYAEIDRDGFGRPRWLWYICPDRVKVQRDGSGQLQYRVDNGIGEKPTMLAPENVFHVKGPSPDGVVGYSMIAMARGTIRLGLQTEKYGETFFGRGPMPGGVLEVPGNPKKEDRDAMRSSFERTYGGAKNAGRVVMLTGGAKFSSMTLPNDDAQFIESRKFGVTEVCRWFGVPPPKVFDLERATFSNVEHLSIEAVQDCHFPHTRRFESEADLKLFGRVMRGRRWTKLNLNALLRGDSKTQTENLTSQVTSALRTPNEAREELDLNPIEGGDELLVQGAMITLDSATNPPEPPQPAPAPAQPDKNPPQPPTKPAQTASMPAQIAETFSPLFAEAYGRLLRVDVDKATRASNKGQLAQHAREFYDSSAPGRIAAVVQPLVAAFLLVCGQPATNAAAYAEEFAADHIRRCLTELSRGTWEKEWPNGRAAEQADTHLRELWEKVKP